MLFRSKSTNYFARVEHDFSDDWKIKLGTSHSEYSSDIRFARYNGAVTPGTSKGTQMMVRAGSTQNRSNAADVTLIGDFQLLEREHSMVLGADYLQTDNHSNRGPQFFANGSGNAPIDWETFDPKNPPALGKWQENRMDHSRSQREGVYSYGKFQLYGPLKAVIGGRYSNYKYKAYARDTNVQTNHSTGTFTPYYALMYDLSANWTAYATMARGTEDQSQYYSPDHKPLSERKTRSYELGLKGELLDGALNTNITLYRAKRYNSAVFLYDDPDFDEDDLSCCYAGDGKHLSQGVELDISGAITPNLMVNGGYTYDDNKTKFGGADGERYANYTPKHTLRAWFSYRLPGQASGLRVGGGAKVQSDVYQSGSVREYNPAKDDFSGPSVPYDFVSSGRAVYNAFAQYRITPQWNMALNIDNIFDKKYFRSVGTTANGNIYGAPRSYMLTLKGNI